MPTIKIDADLGDVIKQSADASEHIAEGGAKIAEHFLHAQTHIVGTILKATALAEVLAHVFEGIKKVNEESSKASKEHGAGVLERGKAFRDLGIDNVDAADQFVRNASGGATIAERTGFLEALASQQRQTRVKIDKREIFDLLRASASGVYSQDELLTDVKQYRAAPTGAEVNARLDSLSPDERRELKIREVEREKAEQASAAQQALGGGVRVVDAEIAARRAEQPGRAVSYDTIKGVLGPFGGLSDIALQAKVARELNEQTRVLKAIEGNTKGKLARDAHGEGAR